MEPLANAHGLAYTLVLALIDNLVFFFLLAVVSLLVFSGFNDTPFDVILFYIPLCYITAIVHRAIQSVRALSSVSSVGNRGDVPRDLSRSLSGVICALCAALCASCFDCFCFNYIRLGCRGAGHNPAQVRACRELRGGVRRRFWD